MASSEDDQVTVSVMQTVAKDIGKKWKELGRQLGIDDEELDCLEYKLNDLHEMAYQTIRKWKDTTQEKTTLGALIHHLKEIDLHKVAQKICKEVSSPDTEPLLPKPTKPKNFLMKITDTRRQKQVLKKVQCTLRQKYTALQMRGLPWLDEQVLTLDEYYVEMSMVTRCKKARAKLLNTGIEQIFSVSKGEKPIRILIEGRPGFGKTTVATKLVYDWSKPEKYIESFHLAYLIALRNFQGNLLELINEISEVNEGDRRYLTEIFYDKSRLILLVLDGYDELAFENEHKLQPLFNKQEFPNITVVITSRPGEFTANKKGFGGSRSQFNEPHFSPTFSHFLDRQISLESMNSKQQNDFFHKHTKGYPQESMAALRGKFDTLVDPEFLKSPLFYLMLIAVFRIDDRFKNVNTKTDFYKHVIDFVVRRFSGTNNVPFSDDDLFSFDKTAVEKPVCAQLMTEFGDFALAALLNSKLTFSQEDIPNSKNKDCKFVQLGLLTKSISLNAHLEKVQYEPVHKTLLEFAAAYNLWATYNEKTKFLDENKRQEWERKVCSVRPSNSSSLLFPLLTGLMGMEANVLFQVLEPFAADYCNAFNNLELSLQEIKLTPSVLESLIPFIPVEWKSTYHNSVQGFYKSPEYNAIITHGSSKGKIKLIDWTYQGLRSREALPENIEVETIRIILSEVTVSEQSGYGQGVLHKIKCTELYFVFVTGSKGNEICTKMWDAFLEYLGYFEFQCISFRLSSSVPQLLSSICSALDIGKLKDASIKLIVIEAIDDLNTLNQKIPELLKLEKVEALELYISDQLLITQQHQLAPMLSEVANSTHLKKFYVRDDHKVSHLNVDLARLCDYGKKSWECLGLCNVNVYCSQEFVNNFQVGYLDLSTTVFDSLSNFFQTCEVSSLSCSASMLGVIHSTLAIITSVNEVNIQLDVLALRNIFSSLQILSLNVALLPDKIVAIPVEDLLLGSYSCLQIKGIEVWGWDRKWDFALDFVKNIVSYLTRVSCEDDMSTNEGELATEPHSLKTLKIQYFLLGTADDPDSLEYNKQEEIYRCLLSIVDLFLQPLKDKVIAQLQIVSHNHFVDNVLNFNGKTSLCWTDVFHQEKGFVVRHDMYGTRDDDSIRGQVEYNRTLAGGPNRLRASSFSKSKFVPKIAMLTHEYEFIGRTDDSLRHQIEHERSLLGGLHRFSVSLADNKFSNVKTSMCEL